MSAPVRLRERVEVAETGQANTESGATTKIAVWSSALTVLFGVISLSMAVTTPPRTGPFATNALAFPYEKAVQYVPGDFRWMYPSLLFFIAFLMLAVCMQTLADPRRRVFGTAGLCLATTSVAMVTLNYLVQLQTVQPALLRGEAESVAAISQYNPHGLFITMESFGFLLMSLSVACLALTLGPSRLERVVAWIYFIAAGLSVATFVGMWGYFGFNLEYLYEITVISIVWLTLIVSGVLLTVVYRRRLASDDAFPA